MMVRMDGWITDSIFFLILVVFKMRANDDRVCMQHKHKVPRGRNGTLLCCKYLHTSRLKTTLVFSSKCHSCAFHRSSRINCILTIENVSYYAKLNYFSNPVFKCIRSYWSLLQFYFQPPVAALRCKEWHSCRVHQVHDLIFSIQFRRIHHFKSEILSYPCNISIFHKEYTSHTGTSIGDEEIKIS